MSLSVQKTGLAGGSVSLVAATAGGDTFANDGATVLHINNAGAGSITVTFSAQQTCNQGFKHDDVVTVANGAYEVVGPFAANRFNDQSGNVNVTYSAVASVTVGAVHEG